MIKHEISTLNSDFQILKESVLYQWITTSHTNGTPFSHIIWRKLYSLKKGMNLEFITTLKGIKIYSVLTIKW